MSALFVMAMAFRAARNCNGGDPEGIDTAPGKEVPCPFCWWPKADGDDGLDESGCMWWAEQAIDRLKEAGFAIMPALPKETT